MSECCSEGEKERERERQREMQRGKEVGDVDTSSTTTRLGQAYPVSTPPSRPRGGKRGVEVNQWGDIFALQGSRLSEGSGGLGE